MSNLVGSLTSRSWAHHYGQTKNQSHFVYRCYDKAGTLLYIGCTVDLKQRIADHRRGRQAASRWLAVFMDRHEVEGPFRDRDAGREAERKAIQAERPLFNYQHTASETQAAWMQRAPIARYLVEHGQIELAIQTACSCWREVRAKDAYMESCYAHVAAQVAGITDLRSDATFTEADWDVA